SAPRGWGSSRRWLWRWRVPRGRTTGGCCRTPSGSKRGLLEEPSQLVGPDRFIRCPDPRREQLQEAAKTRVVEHRRRLDDLGRRLALSGIDHARQGVGEALRQLVHRL